MSKMIHFMPKMPFPPIANVLYFGGETFIRLKIPKFHFWEKSQKEAPLPNLSPHMDFYQLTQKSTLGVSASSSAGNSQQKSSNSKLFFLCVVSQLPCQWIAQPAVSPPACQQMSELAVPSVPPPAYHARPPPTTFAADLLPAAALMDLAVAATMSLWVRSSRPTPPERTPYETGE